MPPGWAQIWIVFAPNPVTVRYDTPEALYGRYVNEMFLAIRLVVDTGMNYFGWPLEKARAHMLEVTSLSDVETDVDRYIAEGRSGSP